MGGKTSKTVTTTDIQNEVSAELKNINKNVTDILNQQITNSTMSMVNETAQSISMATGGGNILGLGNISVKGKGSVFSVDQKVDVKATNQAVANITQDSSAMAKLANTINNSVMDKIQNDSALQQAMQAASNLQKASSTAGGLADMLSSVTKMMESVLTPGTVSNTQSNTIIKNKMKTSIENTNINENKIKSIVENNINNTIKQLNSASCNINTSASNQLTAGNVEVADGGQAIITQVANVNALNSCVLGAAQVANMVTDITSNNESDTSTDTSNKNTAGQTMSTTATVQETTETKAALESAISSFSPFAAGSSGIIICIIILLIIGVGAYLYFTMQKSE
jgi:hypothetical protein